MKYITLNKLKNKIAMENVSLKGRILMELEHLISRSCANPNTAHKFKNLHIALLKKYYNATDVSIDYHRRRVRMDIVMDEKAYDPKKVNLHIPVLPANLWFKNLKEFMGSCIERDSKSLGFYASLIRSFTHSTEKLTAL